MAFFKKTAFYFHIYSRFLVFVFVLFLISVHLRNLLNMSKDMDHLINYHPFFQNIDYEQSKLIYFYNEVSSNLFLISRSETMLKIDIVPSNSNIMKY